MGKIIYVNGNILVKTRYFKSVNAGGYYSKPPEGAEIWEPNKKYNDGSEFFEITDDNPQSFFNEYYAKEEFSTYDNWVSYLYSTQEEVFDNYIQRIEDISSLMRIVNVEDKERALLNKLYFINIITSLDAFICDTILTIITSDESKFEKYYNSLPYNQVKLKMDDLQEQNHIGLIEQKVVYYVLRQSFSNIKTINYFFKNICNVTIENSNNSINEHFDTRHKLVHRNGRDKDDKYIEISLSDLDKVIKDTRNFVDQIMYKLQKN